jgi:hypothetical protein
MTNDQCPMTNEQRSMARVNAASAGEKGGKSCC